MPTPTRPIPELSEQNKINFWRKVDRNGPQMPHMESRCWIWTACKSQSGYGQFGLNGKTHRANRISFVLSGGAFTEDKPMALHRCDNPACVRFEHLFSGSNCDNAKDKAAKGRAPSGDAHHSRTHPERMARGETHGRCKLTDEQCAYIRSSPLTQVALARELGVDQTQIGKIRSGKRRAGLTKPAENQLLFMTKPKTEQII